MESPIPIQETLMEIEELLRHAKRVVKQADKKSMLAHVAICETGYFIHKTTRELI